MGARSVYWERSDGGHLELYFDRPVVPEAVRSWAQEVTPAITVCDEVYPAAGDGKQWRNCKHQAISWPLLRLEGKQVVSCPMHAFAGNVTWFSPGWLEAEGQRPIREALAYCLTPADLIPQHQSRGPLGRPREMPPLSASLPDRRPSERPRKGQTLVEAAIAWWKATHTEEDVFTGNERWKDGYFAVRDERTPSVRQDRDGYPEPMFTDFGTGEKLDLFELHCQLRKLDKRQEIWKIVDEYLIAHGRGPVKRRF